MTDRDALSVVQAAIATTRSHAGVPALDVLDLVMEGRRGAALDFTDPIQPHGCWTSPGTPFGALLALAFDRVMRPEEWRGLTGPDQDAQQTAKLLDIWHGEVVLPFVRRYQLTGAWASAAEAVVANSTFYRLEPARETLRSSQLTAITPQAT